VAKQDFNSQNLTWRLTALRWRLVFLMLGTGAITTLIFLDVFLIAGRSALTIAALLCALFCGMLIALPQIIRRREKLLDAEVRKTRSSQLARACVDAKRTLYGRIELRRLASPVIRAEQEIASAIESLETQKANAEKQLDEQRKRKLLTWWFDLSRPGFDEVDVKIEALRSARLQLIASGEVERTNDRYRALNLLVERRTEEINRAALAAIPANRNDQFDHECTLQNALLLSAFSIPVSAWQDFSQAGSIYDSLREVNGNYAEMSDFDIWLDTLTMPEPVLAGLANLTKGAFFEKQVEADFGGERFEHFNHPDTDILIDGVSYQIKATDSASYINSVADHIPVISTSEISDVTSSLDGGYDNEHLTTAVDLALGGTVIDFADTAVDAILTGVGGVGIVAIVSGVRKASVSYKESGDAVKSLFAGMGVTAISTGRMAVNMAEIGTKSSIAVLTSPPARYTGRLLMSGVERIDKWLEKPEDEASKPDQESAAKSTAIPALRFKKPN
jgi:hypothetical protein